MNNNIIVSKTTVKRLISDIKDLKCNDLSKDGIYYKHDENDMLKGYALIIGPKNTPYEYGNFFFKFDFPFDYPHSPPTVTYCTNDGMTRFHPNLYKNGKVCLSILNTWKGEQWTGCLTIRCVLVTLHSILDNNALLNEPGITEKHKDVIVYDKIIKYRTISSGIIKIISKDLLLDEFKIFWEEIIENFLNNYDNITESFKKIIDKEELLTTRIYNLYVKLNYAKIEKMLENLYNNIKLIKN